MFYHFSIFDCGSYVQSDNIVGCYNAYMPEKSIVELLLIYGFNLWISYAISDGLNSVLVPVTSIFFNSLLWAALKASSAFTS